jgi:hypothetical protein
LAEIPALLRELAVDAAEALKRAGLAASALDRADNRIPFAAADTLLGECAAMTGCSHFGLLVGQRWHLSHFGALGQLMQKDPVAAATHAEPASAGPGHDLPEGPRRGALRGCAPLARAQSSIVNPA